MRNQKITGPQVALRPTGVNILHGPPEGPPALCPQQQQQQQQQQWSSGLCESMMTDDALCCAVLKRSASRLSEHVCVLLFQATGFLEVNWL